MNARILLSLLLAIAVCVDARALSVQLYKEKNVSADSAIEKLKQQHLLSFDEWMIVSKNLITYEKLLDLIGKPDYSPATDLPYTTHNYEWFEKLDDGTKRGTRLEIYTTTGKDGVERIVGVNKPDERRIYIIYPQIFEAIVNQWRSDGTLKE